MGMSASQARLIALTARMSDVEYEGQQINQQRLTLTNKMSEIYEKMTNMDVPTPPSKIDYAYDKYEGKFGGTKYSMKYDDKGVLRKYQEVKGSIVQTTKGSVGGNAASNPANFINKSDPIDNGGVLTPYSPSDFKVVVNYTETHPSTTPFEGAKHLYAGSDGKFYNSEAEMDGQKTADGDDVSWIPTNDIYTGTAYEQASSFEEGKQYIKGDDKNIKFEGTDLISHNDNAASYKDEKFAIQDGNSYKKVSLEEAQKYSGKIFIITDETAFDKAVSIDANEGTKVTSADGKKTGTTLSLDKAKAYDGFNAALQALKNTYSDLDDKALSEKFMAVLYDDGSFAFVQTNDLEGDNSVYIYELGTGTYDEEIEGDIVTDASGNIVGLQTDNGKVTMETTKGYDELEYDAAMASYTAEKAQYDVEQNNLNKQTSIYQRQDKQLELKLKRLDTERTALNTEIDSVKKVIQDASDKGFKTFSG